MLRQQLRRGNRQDFGDANPRRRVPIDRAVPFTHWPLPPAERVRRSGRAPVTLRQQRLVGARVTSLNHFASTFGSNHLSGGETKGSILWDEYTPGKPTLLPGLRLNPTLTLTLIYTRHHPPSEPPRAQEDDDRVPAARREACNSTEP